MKTALKNGLWAALAVGWVTMTVLFLAYVGGRDPTAIIQPFITWHALQLHIWLFVAVHLVCCLAAYFGWGAVVRRAFKSQTISDGMFTNLLVARWSFISAMVLIDTLYLTRGLL